MGDKSKVYRVSVGKYERKRLLEGIDLGITIILK